LVVLEYKEEKKKVWYHVQCANKKLFIKNIKFWGSTKFFSRKSYPFALPAVHHASQTRFRSSTWKRLC